MRKLRVLVVQPTFDKWGHYGLWTARLCQSLSEAGHDVTLFTNKADPGRFVPGPVGFRTIQARDGRYDFATYQEPSVSATAQLLAYFRNSRAILAGALRLAKRESFDAMFVTDTEFATASLLLGGTRGTPPVVMQVNAANFTFGSYQGSLARKMYKVGQRELFRRMARRKIQALTVLTEWHGEQLREQLRLGEAFPILVVPDAGGLPAETIDKMEARRTLGIDYAGPLLLFFGIWRREKGLFDLIDAASHLGDRDFRLLVAGAPVEIQAPELIRRISDAGLDDRVLVRPGFVPDELVSAYLFASDALVLPYAAGYTGGSGPLLKQACTYGLPAVVTDAAGMGRLVRDAGMGLVAEPSDPRSLAIEIRRFIELPDEERALMAEASMRHARENSWEALGLRLAEALEAARVA